MAIRALKIRIGAIVMGGDPESRRRCLHCALETKAVETRSDDVSGVDVWRLAGVEDHLRGVLVGQLAAEGLTGEDLANLSRHQVRFRPADVDERYIGVLQTDFVL